MESRFDWRGLAGGAKAAPEHRTECRGVHRTAKERFGARASFVSGEGGASGGERLLRRRDGRARRQAAVDDEFGARAVGGVGRDE